MWRHPGRHRTARNLVPYCRIQPQNQTEQFLDEWVEDQWTLIAAKPLSAIAHQAAMDQHIQILDISGQANGNLWLQNWMAKRACQYLLVRPDLYIFSAGKKAMKLLQEYKTLKQALA